MTAIVLKHLLNFLVIICIPTFLCFCDSGNKIAETKNDRNILKEIIIDLNFDNLNDTIRLLDLDTSGDPGTFRKIQIRGNNLNPFELIAQNSWDTIQNYLREMSDPEVKCDFIFVKRNKSNTYLILTGFPYPTGLEDFALINVSKNKCNLLTRKNFNEVKAFEDVDKDGNLEIILNPIWSEGLDYIDSLDANVQTYAPFYVYSLTSNSMKLDSSLTKEYNLQNYVWAGLDSVDNVKVLQNKKSNRYTQLK